LMAPGVPVFWPEGEAALFGHNREEDSLLAVVGQAH